MLADARHLITRVVMYWRDGHPFTRAVAGASLLLALQAVVLASLAAFGWKNSQVDLVYSITLAGYVVLLLTWGVWSRRQQRRWAHKAQVLLHTQAVLDGELDLGQLEPHLQEEVQMVMAELKLRRRN